MGWNPANWAIVNKLQGQSNPGKPSPYANMGITKDQPLYTANQAPVPRPGVGAYGPSAGEQYFGVSDVTKTPINTGAAATNTNQAASDPYSKWGGQASFQRLVDSINAQKGNIYGTSLDAARNSGIGLKSSILDLVDSLRSGQSNIDNRGVNNDLAKRQGAASIQGMVGRGIRSTGVMLNNKNAGDSSAAGAAARAYGDVGNREMRGVNNQYELQNREIGLAQEDLYRQRDTGQRKIGESKLQTINNIVADARNKLAALDADAAGSDLPTRIAIEQEKNNIKAQVESELQQYDQLLASEVSKINPMAEDARRAKAAELQNAGFDLGDQAFNFSDQAPAQFQGTGPFASELPLFSLRGRRQEA